MDTEIYPAGILVLHFTGIHIKDKTEPDVHVDEKRKERCLLPGFTKPNMKPTVILKVTIMQGWRWTFLLRMSEHLWSAGNVTLTMDISSAGNRCMNMQEPGLYRCSVLNVWQNRFVRNRLRKNCNIVLTAGNIKLPHLLFSVWNSLILRGNGCGDAGETWRKTWETGRSDMQKMKKDSPAALKAAQNNIMIYIILCIIIVGWITAMQKKPRQKLRILFCGSGWFMKLGESSFHYDRFIFIDKIIGSSNGLAMRKGIWPDLFWRLWLYTLLRRLFWIIMSCIVMPCRADNGFLKLLDSSTSKLYRNTVTVWGPSGILTSLVFVCASFIVLIGTLLLDGDSSAHPSVSLMVLLQRFLIRRCRWSASEKKYDRKPCGYWIS